MPNLHYSAVATALAIAVTGVINTPADAHQIHIYQKIGIIIVITTAIKSKKNSDEDIKKDTTRHTRIQPKNNINTTIKCQYIINQAANLSSLFLHGELPNR